MYRFLLVDGIEGAGKSTACDMIEHAVSSFARVKRVHFPTESPPDDFDTREQEIDWYIDDFQEHLSKWHTEYCEYLQDHDNDTLHPTLFLCDRSPFSTAAYQGRGENHQREVLKIGFQSMFYDWWRYAMIECPEGYEDFPLSTVKGVCAPDFNWEHSVYALWVRARPKNAYTRLLDNGKLDRAKFRDKTQKEVKVHLERKQARFRNYFVSRLLGSSTNMDVDQPVYALENNKLYEELNTFVQNNVVNEFIKSTMFNME